MNLRNKRKEELPQYEAKKDYSGLSYRELQIECKNKGLNAGGKKTELLERLKGVGTEKRFTRKARRELRRRENEQKRKEQKKSVQEIVEKGKEMEWNE